MSKNPEIQATHLQGPVRITIPATVAYDLDAFQKGIANLVERLGCRPCFSGADCMFHIERDFVINEKLEVHPSGRTFITPDTQPALSLDSVPFRVVTLSSKTSHDLNQITRVVADIAGKLGCAPCCSGFDILFRQERGLFVDEAANIHSR